jgi:2,3-bisphosphoglycerate-independent phosphoglycerate mutase
VPLWIVGNAYRAADRPATASIEPSGILADVAPTILEIMALPQPKEMTGKSLLSSISRLPIN